MFYCSLGVGTTINKKHLKRETLVMGLLGQVDLSLSVLGDRYLRLGQRTERQQPGVIKVLLPRSSSHLSLYRSSQPSHTVKVDR